MKCNNGGADQRDTSIPCYNAPCMHEHIAILGGTFDPIHYGHLAIAEEVRWRLQADRVLFVPAAQQPLKSHRHVATADDRLEMVRLATEGNPCFAVSDLEVRRGGRSYTYDTVRALQQEKPEAAFTFVIGADILPDLPRWYALDQLLQLCRFAVVTRPGYPFDLQPLYDFLPMARGRIDAVDGPALDISATGLRDRFERGAPVRYQLPDLVVEYIADHGLYSNRA